EVDPLAENFSFDDVVDNTLLQLVEFHATQSRGRLSLRALAKLSGIPRSTLSLRLRALIQKKLITPEKLMSLVRVKLNGCISDIDGTLADKIETPKGKSLAGIMGFGEQQKTTLGITP
nr:winged helix-turn-helix domain-containing protein [Candidatus Tectomicrobia bacterium]